MTRKARDSMKSAMPDESADLQKNFTFPFWHRFRLSASVYVSVTAFKVRLAYSLQTVVFSGVEKIGNSSDLWGFYFLKLQIVK